MKPSAERRKISNVNTIARLVNRWDERKELRDQFDKEPDRKAKRATLSRLMRQFRKMQHART